MLPLSEYNFEIELSRHVQCYEKTNSCLLPIPATLKLLTFNRSHDTTIDINRFKKVEQLLKKVTPVELVSQSIIAKETNSSTSAINFVYLLHLRDAIGQIFNLRKLGIFDSKISLPENNISISKKAISGINSDVLIWKTFALKVYIRPYISNKHWGTNPNYNLIKTFEFSGKLKELTVSEALKAHLTGSDTEKLFPKNLFS